ncbi:hypothetical protein ACFQVD_09890 [Streptosporangium amethystogenes subsp. fukuiense]|uniref:Uncharacterized protein n=1 Tax=Streptosporangium amethystogenes subsp. fukuiense TaxID=698418 RepID=A0ABW2SWE8_9ACTN
MTGLDPVPGGRGSSDLGHAGAGARLAVADAVRSALVRHRDHRFDDGGAGAGRGDRQAFGNRRARDGTDRFDL